MANSEEYQVLPYSYNEKNCKKIAMRQDRAETDKQPLLEADQIFSGQPLPTPDTIVRPQPRPMFISPEIHPPPKRMLVSESHPKPRQPRHTRSMPQPPQYELSPYSNKHQASIVVIQRHVIIFAQSVPSWIGSIRLIYWSVFTMLCCGLLPGMVALIFALMAESKKKTGKIEEAKCWSMAAIVCNILSMSLCGGVILAGVSYGIAKRNTYNNPYYDY